MSDTALIPEIAADREAYIKELQEKLIEAELAVEEARQVALDARTRIMEKKPQICQLRGGKGWAIVCTFLIRRLKKHYDVPGYGWRSTPTGGGIFQTREEAEARLLQVIQLEEELYNGGYIAPDTGITIAGAAADLNDDARGRAADEVDF